MDRQFFVSQGGVCVWLWTWIKRREPIRQDYYEAIGRVRALGS